MPTSKEFSPQQKSDVWELIAPIGTAMLTSWNGKTLHSRPMQHVNKDFRDGDLLFFTDRRSDKVEEVQHYNSVCLNYADPQSQTYVCLSGTVSLTQDRELIEQYWNAFVAAWFPEGKQSEHVALLRVQVQQGELWDASSNRMKQLFEIAKANVVDAMPDMGRHEKIA